MERDFLGLSSISKVVAVKEEIKDDDIGCIDSGLTKGFGIQWPFPKKFSSVPHLMAPKAAQEEKIEELDAYGQFQKRSTGQIQNMSGAPMKEQLFGPTLHGHNPISGTTIGFTRPWDAVKSVGSPAQLTIFYAGTVCVVDDISSEKAEAIMGLAGNGSQKPHVEEPNFKLAAADGVATCPPVVAPPSSTILSPISISSQSGAQSGSGSTSTDELVETKPRGLPTTPASKADHPKIFNGTQPVSRITMMPSAVPQARKASLARFLEKRKERVMSAAPYNPTLNSPKYAELDSKGSNLSATSAAGHDPQNICSHE